MEPDDLQSAARPLLRAFQEATGLDTTYLTRIARDEDVQHILYSHHDHGIDIPEGLAVPWDDTLCRRALEAGRLCTTNVPELWGDSHAARALGIVTYVSAPVTLPDGQVWGTLCGAAGTVRELDDHARSLLRLFAGLLADRVEVEQDRQATHRRAEAAERLLRERAMVIAELQHKLKGPLTSAVGWVELANRRGRLEGETRAWVERAGESLLQLDARIDRLLVDARDSILRGPADQEEFDLGEAVLASVDRMSGAAADHRLETDLAAVTARADPGAVADVVEHLVENAVKYAPAGTTITVSVRGLDGPTLTVEDEGEGLPDGLDIFSPFVRGRDDKPGVGLGLHIARTLVESSGGTIEAGASPSGGARFTVRWAPAAESDR